MTAAPTTRTEAEQNNETEVVMRSAEDILADDRLWTVPDVARFLSMSTSWVSKRAADGTLPTLRIGRAVRFEPEAVRAFARGEQQDAQVVSMPARGRR